MNPCQASCLEESKRGLEHHSVVKRHEILSPWLPSLSHCPLPAFPTVSRLPPVYLLPAFYREAHSYANNKGCSVVIWPRKRSHIGKLQFRNRTGFTRRHVFLKAEKKKTQAVFCFPSVCNWWSSCRCAGAAAVLPIVEADLKKVATLVIDKAKRVCNGKAVSIKHAATACNNHNKQVKIQPCFPYRIFELLELSYLDDIVYIYKSSVSI